MNKINGLLLEEEVEWFNKNRDFIETCSPIEFYFAFKNNDKLRLTLPVKETNRVFLLYAFTKGLTIDVIYIPDERLANLVYEPNDLKNRIGLGYLSSLSQEEVSSHIVKVLLNSYQFPIDLVNKMMPMFREVVKQ